MDFYRPAVLGTILKQFILTYWRIKILGLFTRVW